MKRPGPKVLILISVCIAGITLWLILRFGGTEQEGSPSKGRPLVAAASPAKSATSAMQASVPDFGSDAFKKYVLDRTAKWLESRNRDAASLVALWDLTGDESLLDEAAEKFLNDPRVCVAMINRFGSGEKALPWVERLIAIEPGNPAAWYWKAQLSAKSNNPEQTLEALKKAVGTKGQPDTHLRDRMVTVREAALASGSTLKEAAAAALIAPLSKNGSHFLAGGTMSFLRNELAAAKAAGNPERVAEIAGLGAASAEHVGLIGASTLLDDLVRVSILRNMLGELDPGTPFGNDGKTVRERLDEVTAEKEETGKLIESVKGMADLSMQFLSEAQAAEYTDRFILHGERAAMQWLEKQPTALPEGGAAAPQKE
jgi:hypothetical protein